MVFKALIRLISTVTDVKNFRIENVFSVLEKRRFENRKKGARLRAYFRYVRSARCLFFFQLQMTMLKCDASDIYQLFVVNAFQP